MKRLIALLLLLPSLAFGQTVKSLIGQEDINWDADGTGTFTRKTSTGGTLTLTKVPSAMVLRAEMDALQDGTGEVDVSLVTTDDLITKGPWVDVRYLATGDGTTDDTASVITANADKGTKALVFPAGTYLLSNVTGASGTWILLPGATLKHAAAATDHMIEVHATADFSIIGYPGSTINGNRANQTGRYATIYSAGSGNLRVQGLGFTGTVYAGIQTNGTPASLRILDNTFVDMAEHGGSAGEISLAGHFTITSGTTPVWISGNTLTAAAASTFGKGPGGFLLTGSGIGSLNAEWNWFDGIGQVYAANEIGNIDLYTENSKTVIVGNRFKNYGYVPLKLQNSGAVDASHNIIDGAQDDDAKMAIAFQHVRSFAASRNDWIASHNIIRISGTSNNGLNFTGDADGTYYSNRVIADGNIIVGAADALTSRWVVDLSANGNIIADSTGTALVIDETDQGTGAPTIATATIRGGAIMGGAETGIFARSNVTNLKLAVDGVAFKDNTTYHITGRNITELAVRNCQFSGTPTDLIDAATVPLLLRLGNTADAGATFALSSITTNIQAGNSWQGDSVTYQVQTGAKVGGTAGWSVNDGTNRGGLAKLPAGQSASTLVVPLTGLPVGYTITGYTVRGQVESAGNTATLDAALRSLTVATADLTDAAVTDGAIAQVSVTADAQVASAVTGLSSVITAGKTFYCLVTGTTGANTDFDLSAIEVTVRP